MDAYVLNHSEMNGLAYDDIAELFSTSDYLLEAELSLPRDVNLAQRKGQLVDLKRAVDVIRMTRSQLPRGEWANWADYLEKRAQACITEVKSEVAFLEFMAHMSHNDHSKTSAA